jgi:hypothetical protein
MVESRRDLDFSLKPLQPDTRGEIRVQNLDGHGTAVLEIARQIHRGHATAPQLALEVVAVLQGSLQAV